ncbi:MAG: hypothetical protein AB1390_08320 [Nitrospirota bacterium]
MKKLINIFKKVKKMMTRAAKATEEDAASEDKFIGYEAFIPRNKEELHLKNRGLR